MERVFEKVPPEALVVGDVVIGNGALWRIISFGKWACGWSTNDRTEFVTVECIDSRGIRPFKEGFCKQFALYPHSGVWERETHDTNGQADLRKFVAGTLVEDAERHIGTVVGVIFPAQIRVRWHKGYSSTEPTDRLRIVEEAS